MNFKIKLPLPILVLVFFLVLGGAYLLDSKVGTGKLNHLYRIQELEKRVSNLESLIRTYHDRSSKSP